MTCASSPAADGQHLVILNGDDPGVYFHVALDDCPVVQFGHVKIAAAEHVGGNAAHG